VVSIALAVTFGVLVTRSISQPVAPSVSLFPFSFLPADPEFDAADHRSAETF
jgi:hypothetical protein